jgi:hypothetical protein
MPNYLSLTEALHLAGRVIYGDDWDTRGAAPHFPADRHWGT